MKVSPVVDSWIRWHSHLPRHMLNTIFRDQIMELQGGICAICGRPMDRRAKNNHERPSLEHVVALALGGADAPGNYVVAHMGCNEAKGSGKPTACECIWLMAVNARIGVGPQKW